MTAETMALETKPEEDPAAMYARLERNAARKGYTLNRTILGFMLKRGTVSKHFGRMETGFQLLREPTCSD